MSSERFTVDNIESFIALGIALCAATDLSTSPYIPKPLQTQLKALSTRTNNLTDKIYQQLPVDIQRRIGRTSRDSVIIIEPRAKANQSTIKLPQSRYLDMMEMMTERCCRACDGTDEHCALRESFIDLYADPMRKMRGPCEYKPED